MGTWFRKPGNRKRGRDHAHASKGPLQGTRALWLVKTIIKKKVLISSESHLFGVAASASVVYEGVFRVVDPLHRLCRQFLVGEIVLVWMHLPTNPHTSTLPPE